MIEQLPLRAPRAQRIRPTDGYVRTNLHATQDDAINSGLVRTIGASAFQLWHVLKARGDKHTGRVEISYRAMMRTTGFAKATVWRKLATLERHGLLRRLPGMPRQRRTYVARECLPVYGHDHEVIAALLWDYIPKHTFARRKAINAVFDHHAPLPAWIELWAAPGYVYDHHSGLLYGRPAAE